jgi:hypothetical protein
MNHLKAEVWGQVTTDGQYVWGSSSPWDLRSDINSVWILLSCLCWAPSLTRGRVCVLSATMLTIIPSHILKADFFLVMYKNSVRTSKETYCDSAKTTTRLMLFKDTMTVYWEQRTIAIYRQDAEFQCARADGAYTNHWALDGWLVHCWISAATPSGEVDRIARAARYLAGLSHGSLGLAFQGP